MRDVGSRLNLAEYFLDARLADGMGDRVAIRTASGTVTYREVVEESGRCAHMLAARGVRPEERVLVALADGPAYVAALFGVLRLGAVAVMINPDLPHDQLRYFFDYTRARAIVHEHGRGEALAAAAAGLPRPPVFIEAGGADYRAECESHPPRFEIFPSHRDDVAIWLFSGGTTGRPKAVLQTHRSFVNTTERYGKGVLGIGPDDITISVPKLFFGYATGANLFFPFSVGASCVLFPERCTADALFAHIRQHRPTILVNVPSMVQQMLAHPEADEQDLSCLRLSTSAGEALPVELHERWNRRFGVDLLDGLGTAEMWHIFLTNRPGDVVPGTLGRVVPGFEVKLCDADGREVPDGEVGVMWVRGDSRGIAYWQRMDDTMQAFRGEWYASGDMLTKNADGTYTYCGRADDMLKVSGKWLAPAELENCLLQHEAVREAVVVGVRDANGLVKPVAFVVCDDPTDAMADELKAFAKQQLEPYKYPREVFFRDALPRTHLGKIDRGALSRAAAGR